MSNLPPGVTLAMIDDRYGREDDFCPECGEMLPERGGTCDNRRCGAYHGDPDGDAIDRAYLDWKERDL